jgi:hypothetical protein
MQYPHWLMVAGAVLVVLGFIGLGRPQASYAIHLMEWMILGLRSH